MCVRLALLSAVLVAAGCSSTEEPALPAVAGLAVAESDASVPMTVDRLTAALEAAGPVRVVARVDHAAGATAAGLDLRPTRLVLFGDPALGTPLIQANPQAGLDLPQNMLVYRDAEGRTVVAYNSAEYLAQRHGVGTARTLADVSGALATFAGVAIGDEDVEAPPAPAGVSRDEGVVTVTSTSDVASTYARLRSAISRNDALTIVAELDHQANAASVDLTLRPNRLVVFGNPALGTPLMQAGQTVGVDLPQKMLVYETASGDVFVAYNDPRLPRPAPRPGLAGRGGDDPRRPRRAGGGGGRLGRVGPVGGAVVSDA